MDDTAVMQCIVKPYSNAMLSMEIHKRQQVAASVHAYKQAGAFPWLQMTKQKDGTGILLSLESKDISQLQSAQQLLVETLPKDVHATSIEYDSPTFARNTTPRSSLELGFKQGT